MTYIFSPEDRTVGLFIAKDDGLAIWINGKKIFDNNTWSCYVADEFIATCPLRKGWNVMLVKNANWHGCWAWSIRVCDPDGQLRFSNVPPPKNASSSN